MILQVGQGSLNATHLFGGIKHCSKAVVSQGFIKMWAIFGGIKVDAKIYGNFERFPLVHCLGWQ